MIRLDIEGGPLSHVAWAIFGTPYSLRWWLCAGGFNGWQFWLSWHFMFMGRAGVPELAKCIAGGLVLGTLAAVTWHPPS